MAYNAAVSKFSDTYQNFFSQNEYSDVVEQLSNDLIPEELNHEAKNVFKMLSAANNSLYDGCENYSQMSIIGRMMNLKTNYNCSGWIYDDICTLMREA